MRGWGLPGTLMLARSTARSPFLGSSFQRLVVLLFQSMGCVLHGKGWRHKLSVCLSALRGNEQTGTSSACGGLHCNPRVLDESQVGEIKLCENRVAMHASTLQMAR